MASGRLVPISISKTAPPLPSVIASTAMPAEVRSAASCRSSTLRSTKSRSHCEESFMKKQFSKIVSARRQVHPLAEDDPLAELLQKPHVAIKKQLDVVHSVLEDRHPIGSHAEGESRNFLRVVAVVLYELKYIWIHHPAAQDLDPARGLARAAGLAAPHAFAAADEARHHHFGAWFGERKERRTKVCLHARPKQRLHRVVERALQISESDVRINRQTLHLVKHRRMAGIGRIVAMHLAGNHDAQRRFQLLHGADLHRGGVGTQQQTLAR